MNSHTLPLTAIVYTLLHRVLWHRFSRRTLLAQGRDKALLELDNETLLARSERILLKRALDVLISGEQREHGISITSSNRFKAAYMPYYAKPQDIMVVPVDMPLLTVGINMLTTHLSAQQQRQR